MKKMRLCKAFLPLLVLLMTFTAWADDSEIPEEEVVVTATRTSQNQSESPGMTEVITKEAIKESETKTVAELLDQEGFVISSYGGASGTAEIRLDGGEANHTLILVNGVPVNSGTTGRVDLSYFPTAAISKIEVTHGPLSSLYGSSATGGVVNIITDLTGDPSNTFRFSYGNTDYGDAASRTMMVSSEQTNYGFVFGGGANDGFRDNSAAKDYFLIYQYDFIQKDDEFLSLYLQSVAKENEMPGPEYDATSDDEQTDKIHSVNLNGRKYLLRGLWEYKIHGNHWKETAFTFNTNYEYNYRNFGIDIAGLYGLGKHELLIGTSLVDSATDSTDYGEHDLTGVGIFAQDNWSLNEQWKLVYGLRRDAGSEYNSPVCPKISLVHLVNRDFSLKFGYGKSFRAPAISDLYSPYGGNPDLEPEKGERYDITGDWRKNIHTVSVNLYQSDLKDGIDWVWVGPTDWDYAAQNFEKVKTTGININWRIKWNEHLNSTLKYGWLDKKKWDSAINSYSEDNFFGRNKLALGLNLKYASFSSNLVWEYVWERSDQTYTDPGSNELVTVKMGDYNVLNWNSAYIYNDTLTYNVTVSNLTDEDYAIYFGYPVSEREYKLSAIYHF